MCSIPSNIIQTRYPIETSDDGHLKHCTSRLLWLSIALLKRNQFLYWKTSWLIICCWFKLNATYNYLHKNWVFGWRDVFPVQIESVHTEWASTKQSKKKGVELPKNENCLFENQQIHSINELYIYDITVEFFFPHIIVCSCTIYIWFFLFFWFFFHLQNESAHHAQKIMKLLCSRCNPVIKVEKKKLAWYLWWHCFRDSMMHEKLPITIYVNFP